MLIVLPLSASWAPNSPGGWWSKTQNSSAKWLFLHLAAGRLTPSPGPAHDSANICKNNSCVNCSSRHSRHALHNSATHLPLPPQPCTLICSRLSGVSRCWFMMAGVYSIDTKKYSNISWHPSEFSDRPPLIVLTNFCPTKADLIGHNVKCCSSVS